MSYDSNDLTTHLLYHGPENLNDNCDFCEMAEVAKNNLFSANHRNQMLTVYGYTDAQSVTIEELTR